MEEGEPRLPRCEGTEPGGGAGGRSRAPANGNRAPSTGAPRRAAGALSLRNPISFHAAFPPPHLPSNLVLSRLLGSKLPALPHRPLLSAAFPLRFSGSSPGTPRPFRPPRLPAPSRERGPGGPFLAASPLRRSPGKGGALFPATKRAAGSDPRQTFLQPPPATPRLLPPGPLPTPPGRCLCPGRGRSRRVWGCGQGRPCPPPASLPPAGGYSPGSGGDPPRPGERHKGLRCLRPPLPPLPAASAPLHGPGKGREGLEAGLEPGGEPSSRPRCSERAAGSPTLFVCRT